MDQNDRSKDDLINDLNERDLKIIDLEKRMKLADVKSKKQLQELQIQIKTEQVKCQEAVDSLKKVESETEENKEKLRVAEEFQVKHQVDLFEQEQQNRLLWKNLNGSQSSGKVRQRSSLKIQQVDDEDYLPSFAEILSAIQKHQHQTSEMEGALQKQQEEAIEMEGQINKLHEAALEIIEEKNLILLQLEQTQAQQQNQDLQEPRERGISTNSLSTKFQQEKNQLQAELQNLGQTLQKQQNDHEDQMSQCTMRLRDEYEEKFKLVEFQANGYISNIFSQTNQLVEQLAIIEEKLKMREDQIEQQEFQQKRAMQRKEQSNEQLQLSFELDKNLKAEEQTKLVDSLNKQIKESKDSGDLFLGLLQRDLDDTKKALELMTKKYNKIDTERKKNDEQFKEIRSLNDELQVQLNAIQLQTNDQINDYEKRLIDSQKQLKTLKETFDQESIQTKQQFEVGLKDLREKLIAKETIQASSIIHSESKNNLGQEISDIRGELSTTENSEIVKLDQEESKLNEYNDDHIQHLDRMKIILESIHSNKKLLLEGDQQKLDLKSQQKQFELELDLAQSGVNTIKEQLNQILSTQHSQNITQLVQANEKYKLQIILLQEEQLQLANDKQSQQTASEEIKQMQEKNQQLTQQLIDYQEKTEQMKSELITKHGLELSELVTKTEDQINQNQQQEKVSKLNEFSDQNIEYLKRINIIKEKITSNKLLIEERDQELINLKQQCKQVELESGSAQSEVNAINQQLSKLFTDRKNADHSQELSLLVQEEIKLIQEQNQQLVQKLTRCQEQNEEIQKDILEKHLLEISELVLINQNSQVQIIEFQENQLCQTNLILTKELSFQSQKSLSFEEITLIKEQKSQLEQQLILQQGQNETVRSELVGIHQQELSQLVLIIENNKIQISQQQEQQSEKAELQIAEQLTYQTSFEQINSIKELNSQLQQQLLELQEENKKVQAHLEEKHLLEISQLKIVIENNNMQISQLQEQSLQKVNSTNQQEQDQNSKNDLIEKHQLELSQLELVNQDNQRQIIQLQKQQSDQMSLQITEQLTQQINQTSSQDEMKLVNQYNQQLTLQVTSLQQQLTSEKTVDQTVNIINQYNELQIVSNATHQRELNLLIEIDRLNKQITINNTVIENTNKELRYADTVTSRSQLLLAEMSSEKDQNLIMYRKTLRELYEYKNKFGDVPEIEQQVRELSKSKIFSPHKARLSKQG